MSQQGISCTNQTEITSHSNKLLGKSTQEKFKSLNDLAPTPGMNKIVRKWKNKIVASVVVLTSTLYK